MLEGGDGGEDAAMSGGGRRTENKTGPRPPVRASSQRPGMIARQPHGREARSPPGGRPHG